MHFAHRAAPSVLLTCLLLAGCSPDSLGGLGGAGSASPAAGTPTGSAAGSASVRSIAVGAGPQKTYTVQQQPGGRYLHLPL